MISLQAGKLLAGLGYQTWLGRFCDDRSSHGVGLQRYQGGMEGGPLLLFNASLPDKHALVLAPMDNFFSSILALRGDPRPASCPLASLPLGSGANFSLVVGASAETPRCTAGDCVLEQDVDYDGNDVYSVAATPDAGACCAVCQAEPACGFFSLVNTTCYLKYSAAGRTAAPGHVSGRVVSRTLVFGVQGRVTSVKPVSAK